MIFAYADPPYIGCAGLYPEKREVNHDMLIEHLIADYPDGWALSASAPSLQYLSDLLAGKGLLQHRGDYRVMAWVKPFAIFKPNVGVAYTWEPVIVRGGRKRTREQATTRDHVIEPEAVVENITLRKGLTGAKPARFCDWLLDVLSVEPGDELHDLFPGTGSMGAALERRIARCDSQGALSLAPASEAQPTPSALDGEGKG